MRWKQWPETWSMTSPKFNAPFLKLGWQPQAANKNAAWKLDIERFTRDIIKRNGRGCSEFTKLAIEVINQVVRPFTARWHRLSEQVAFAALAQCQIFRQELAAL